MQGWGEKQQWMGMGRKGGEGGRGEQHLGGAYVCNFSWCHGELQVSNLESGRRQ